MNKTVILIQLIISSSLPNPIDEIIISRDVDLKVTEPEILLKIDGEKAPKDDIVTSSELNQKNKLYPDIRLLKGSEEQQEDNVIGDLKFISSNRNINSAESKENEEVVTVSKLSLQLTLKSIGKTEDIVQTKLNDIESTTTNFEWNERSGDDFEGPTDFPIEFNLSKNAEEEFESSILNDEFNTKWDLFDDINSSTRRMMKNFEELSEEMKKSSFMEDGNINSVSNLNDPENNYHRASGVAEEQEKEADDYLENIQNKNITEYSAQLNEEEKINNKYVESLQNHNVEGNNKRQASSTIKEEKQHSQSIRTSNLSHGSSFAKIYDTKSTEVPVNQHIPFIYPSPSEIQRYNKPAIPVYPIKPEYYNNHKINRISPVTRRQEFEDYNSKSYYRKHLNTPAVLAQKSMTIDIISKLVEASKNSHKLAAGNEYFKNFKPLTIFHNVNKNMYVPTS